MCGECNWDPTKGGTFIHVKCDCGNFVWVKTPLKIAEKNPVYRCTKCDNLKEIPIEIA